LKTSVISEHNFARVSDYAKLKSMAAAKSTEAKLIVR
jgi:hypothetical protein